jgi:predicted MFS family arabinose efflux permease
MNAPTREQLRNNVTKALVFGFFQVFLVVMPVIVPFFESRGLDMQDIFVLQALFALVVLVMEVPSGYLADLLGRKQTMVIGAACLAAGHTMLLFADGFWGLAVFEVALGVGVSLVSGADIALVYDSEALGEDPARRQRIVSRLYGVHTVGEALASVLASVLILWSMEATVVAQVIVGWVPLVVALTLREPPGERLARGDHWGNLKAITAHLVRNGAVLRLTFIALSVWSLTTFYAVWLLQKLWQTHGIGLAWFGWLWAGYLLVAAAAGQFADRVERWMGSTALLVVIGLLPIAGYLGLAGFGVAGGLVAALGFFVARGLGLVVLRNAFNARVPGRFRATANSLASFGFRGSFVITGPVVGWVLDAWGMGTTLVLLAIGSTAIVVGILLPLILAVRASRPAPGAAVSPG